MQFARNMLGLGDSSGGNNADSAGAPSTIMPPLEMPSVGMCRMRLVDTLTGHQERVWSIDWNPTCLVLASCGSDRAIRLWGQENNSSEGVERKWKCLDDLEGEHSRTLRQVSWSPQGGLLAAASFDATVSLWRRCSPQFDMMVEAVLDGHENEVKSVAWDSTGRRLATCSRDKSVWIWDRGQPAAAHPPQNDEDETVELEEEEPEREFECAAVLTGHIQDVKSVRWVPHCDVLLSCGYDDTIKVWEESTHRKDDWHCTKTLAGHSSTVWQLAFQQVVHPALADHLLMASVSDDCTIGVWKRIRGSGSAEGGDDDDEDDDTDWCSWSRLATVSGEHERTIYSVDWAPPLPGMICSSLFAVGSGEDSITLHEVSSAANAEHPTGQDVNVCTVWKEENAHTADVNCVKWYPKTLTNADGAPYWMLASCSDDGTIKIWAVEPQATVVDATGTASKGDVPSAE